MKQKKLISWLLIVVGLLVIIGTHTLMFFYPMSPGWMEYLHASLNLISAASIITGIIIKK